MKADTETQLKPFHLALQVHDLAEARAFYGGLLACREGRSDHNWVDFDFYGHQLVCHVNSAFGHNRALPIKTNLVGQHQVPVPHFGMVLDMESWQELADRFKARQVPFLVEPHIRFQGQAGEQATLFVLDPSGNALEFKGFRNISEQLFETETS